MLTDIALKVQAQSPFARGFSERTHARVDLPVICLWSVLGLLLTIMLLALGFRTELEQGLAIAG